MNKCELAAALQSWSMAINHKLALNDHTPIERLAQDYGRAISTPENIDEASHLLNWDKLLTLIEEVNPHA